MYNAKWSMVWTGSLLWFFKNLFFFQTVHGKIYRCSCFLRSRLTYSRPLGGETIFFILYLFCRVVYPMSFAIHCYNYLEKAQICHLCMMVRSHYLKTIVEKHISTLRSISNQFFPWNWNDLFDRDIGAPSKMQTLAFCNLKFIFQVFIHDKIPWFVSIVKMWLQKQPSTGVFSKSCSDNMQQIYKRTPSVILVKLLCNFIEITAAYFQNTLS